MRPRRYTFSSTWLVHAPLGRCWAFLTSPGQRWLDWWPMLRSVEVRRTDGLVDSAARCEWRSPLGYRLRTDLRMVDLVPQRWVELAVSGDVAGAAVVTFAGVGGGTRGGVAPDGHAGGGHAEGRATRIDVTWAVTTTRRWMNVTAPVLRPVFAWGHRTVMRRGEHGLNVVLDQDRGPGPPAGHRGPGSRAGRALRVGGSGGW